MARLKIYEYNLIPVDDSWFGDLLFEDYCEKSGVDKIKMMGMTDSDYQRRPDLKDPTIIDYAEESGERISINKNRQAFEYTVTITCLLSSELPQDEVNKLISAMEVALQGIHIAMFNIDRKQMMVGYIVKGFDIGDAEKFEVGVNYRDRVDFEMTLYVNDPDLCDYDTIDLMPTEDEGI